MPKIPTFTARGRPTTDTASVRTGIQISPTATVGAALLPAAEAITNYSIKKRNSEEKLIASKAILELQSESDKIIQSQKENIVEEDAINNWKQTFTPLVQQKISSIKNKRVKNLIETGIDLQNAESIYELKKNSFTALQNESLVNVNNKITSNIGKYATSDNAIMKVKYKTITKEIIRDYAEEFNLPKNVLDQKLKAADRDFLLSDINQFAGLVNGAEQINNLDISLKGTNFLNDEDFGAGVYSAYNNKISELTIKGNPDSDYDRALELVDELKNFKRKANGYKVDTGKFSVQIDNLEQKVLTEKISHDLLVRKQGDNKLFYDYANSLKGDLSKSIADPFAQPELTDRLAATEMEEEFDKRIKQYIFANPDASLEEKRAYARSTTYVLQNRYEENQILKLSAFNLQQSDTEIVDQYNTIVSDISKLTEGTLDQDTIESYESLARANGYQDIQSFMNDYLPLLKSQLPKGQ
tara:strand:+ start:426 stop:1835 length:1410 start_codon:yes stop_codon:yes gene_type:complete